MLKDKNSWIGIFLIILTTAGFFYLNQKTSEMAALEAANAPKLDTAKLTPAEIKTVAPAQLTSIDTSKNVQPIAPTSSWSAASEEKLTLIENDLMQVYLSNKGGRIAKVVMKKYTTYEGEQVTLFDKKNSTFGYNIDGQNTENMFFEIEGASATIKDKDLSTVSYMVKNGDKSFKQTYIFTGNSYLIKYDIQPINITTPAQPMLNLTWSDNVQKQEQEVSRERMYSSIYYLDPNEKHIQYLDISKNEERAISTAFKYMSFKQQFFNTTIISDKGFAKATTSSHHMTDDTGYVKNYKSTISFDAANTSMNIFMGPNNYNLLKDQNWGGEKLIPLSQDFFLTRWTKIFNEYMIIPMFNFFSKFMSNYGLIILLITLLIKLVLMPLSYKSYKLIVAQKVLKPELDAIKKKYGDDQQKFAQEQMKVMNSAGVSQLSGCLPALLQIPLLMAMVSFFPASIELRHESFLWATDLSTYDSILAIPNIPVFGNHISLFTLLMAATQILMTWYMQRNQPTNAMQDQMKFMMYFMPLIMMVMFNNWPAAMTYYYLLQNIITIAQQWFFTTYVIKEDAVRAEIEAYKKSPPKKGMFQQKMDEVMAQAEEAKKQQNRNKK
jgi:YidC/Oxa1 family membrane protein insertase